MGFETPPPPPLLCTPTVLEPAPAPQLPSSSSLALPRGCKAARKERHTGGSAAAVDSPDMVLRRLLLEWYTEAAELLIGEAAAADVLGYADTPHLSACEEKSDENDKDEVEGKAGGAWWAASRMPLSTKPEAGGERAILGSSAVDERPSRQLGASFSLASEAVHASSSPADRLVARLASYVPALGGDTAASLSSGVPRSSFSSTAAAAAASVSPTRSCAPAGRRTLAVPLFGSAMDVECSVYPSDGPAAPSTSLPTAAPHAAPRPLRPWSPWWLPLADVVLCALDAVDAVANGVVAAAGHITAAALAGGSGAQDCSPSSSSLSCSMDGLTSAMESDQRLRLRSVSRCDSDEASCIMAGLLLSRHVRLRSGAAYRPVVPPLLVALDLDLTVLRCPLSSLAFREVRAMSTASLRDLFIDADFFVRFCAAVTRRGHELAICSLTEGVSDQQSCGVSVAEVVLALFSSVLPAARSYLVHSDDVLCLPKAIAGPGKLRHLEVLQQRRNARDGSPSSQDDSSSMYSSQDLMDGIACSSRQLMLPRWLSTDVLLVDDDRENCRLAAAQGYHAAQCAETGMTAAWFASRPDVQVLLGLTAAEIADAQA